MKIRPITSGELLAVRCGETMLRDALRYFVAGGCPKTAARVRAALKSAGGAVRHAERRFSAPKEHTT